MLPPPPCSTLFPYTTLFRSDLVPVVELLAQVLEGSIGLFARRVLAADAVDKLLQHRPSFRLVDAAALDRKSTRLNSSHVAISYAVFCLKKKKQIINNDRM